MKLYRSGGDSLDSLEERSERRLDRRWSSGVRASESRCAMGLTMTACVLGTWLGGVRFGSAVAFFNKRRFFVFVILVLICVDWNWGVLILNWYRDRVIDAVRVMLDVIGIKRN